MALVDEHLDKARVIEKALMRIKDISSAKSAEEVTYRFGLATGYVAAILDAGVVDEDRWEELLILAEETQESHALSTGASGRFDG
ncbi:MULTISPECIES: hypothetical protein [Pseudomonas]|jgi:hypothetical protein|uniref:Uncharacterized protein n=1 Tax=Pseudomonas putida (strain ATCC 47054 / DSM 6125 / CFBP 8728 / NCIMB 11950 / KT2440) TaxID=160488 RepID=Q88EL3_PSEPK|nr:MULTISPECIES: hypothetical protein [Pseudomonas]AAN70024.1 conserved protein of unknown function [Pseudomonas putida KT2440]KMU96467.1 hypothetical protein AC138_09325 [Pseudomonas putida]KMY28617.1 hypothetical protein AA993_22520 [Pseudomonas putida]MDD2080524.1 hypothetical protein [Pseudomonas putida]QRI87550.1 hypothetical protein JQN61_09255 [Pseudomonas putida]